MIAPTFEPALNIPVAIARSFTGNHSAVALIAPGKLADIVLVEGDPLLDIANAGKVKRVIMNGRMFTIEDLLSGKAKDAPR